MKRKVIITGSNSGIGKAAAKKFTAEGHFVTMACRDPEKGEKARKEVMMYSGSNRADLMQLDVSSFKSITNFCDEYRKKHEGLDVLIHNAAIFNHGEKKFQVSADNLELTFATNVFGPFLMTHLLKDLLALSDDARILHACSTNIKHFFDPKRQLNFDELDPYSTENGSYNAYKLYGDSKMALLMLTFLLAEEMKHDEIKVNAVMINNIRQEWQSLMKVKSWYKPVGLAQNLFAYPTSMMADVYYKISTSGTFYNVSGRLINHRQEVVMPSELQDDSGFLAVFNEIRKGKTYPAYADNSEIQDKLWLLCQKVTDRYHSPFTQKR